MLFRPEEVHRASGIGSVFEPLPKGHRHIRHQAFGLGSEDFSVTDLHQDREPAIETGSIDLDCFPREKPADCQRFERSLAKPFLLSFNGDSILSGKIVEWGKRGDVIRIWK